MTEWKTDLREKTAALCAGGTEVWRHAPGAPGLFLGVGGADITMRCGNFEIAERVEGRFAARLTAAEGNALRFSVPELSAECELCLSEENGVLRVAGSASGRINRVWLRFPAVPAERVTGGGEQFSCLDLRGRRFPVWTREQGVGRNKATEITRLADERDGGGGDYHTTFFPQPTFVSSRRYFVHLENTEFSALDFRAEAYHELEVWSPAFSLVLGAADSYPALLGLLTGVTGRQPALPDWAMAGFWLGVQGGTERAAALRDRCLAGGVPLSAVWIQDWEGRRVTSFGKRLQWDWRRDRALYPGLEELIRSDAARGIRWMGYINPYLVEGGALFAEAREKGFFVKDPAGADYLFDFGEFNCGVVDLTLPAAFAWYKNVIRTNLIGLGFRGWMADFGEYLPADAVCAGGSGETLHNRWPVLWARCCREAVEQSGLLGDCVFFMRAGGAGSGGYSTLTWAGDQNVDWSPDDGLPSVITAALTLGMSGFGLHCSDIGGYTSLFRLQRSEELLMRWLEFAAFTPVMRSHEGNRPDTNPQLYDTPELIAFTAKTARLHARLLPYLKRCVEENARAGVPVMRPLFFEQDVKEAWDRDNFAYLLGPDLLVAPVVRPGETARTVWLPAGAWSHLWTGETYAGGVVSVPAPLGQPPVFVRGTDRAAFAALLSDA